MKSIVDMKNLRSGGGATRALSVLASYMRFVGVPEEKAYNIFQKKANEWDAETSNIFESWYGCEHLDKPTCFVPSCETMRTKGSAYPHPELGELGICVPDKRCEEIKSPMEYHKKEEGLKEPGHYISVDDKGHVTPHIKELADDLVATYHLKTLSDTKEVLFYKDGLYHFNGEAIILAECERIFKHHANTHNVSEVIGHIQRSTFIERPRLNNDKYVLNLKNGLLNIKTRNFKDHTSDFLSTIRIPITYDPNADCPNIKQFLLEVLFERDVPTVEEMIGYCLYPDYIFQYWFLLHGEGDNGKSTFLSLLTRFLGTENIAAIGLQNLNQRFATMGLFGKLANIVADLSSQDLRHTHNLKALTGGDIVTAEPKFKNPFTFVNHAKLLYSCNLIPISEDKTRAFYRRVFYIAFPNTFTGERIDRNILKKLTTEEELSGLLNLAIKGLKRLFENNEFTGALQAEEMKEKYERASNPVYGFFKDCCELDTTEHITKSDFYDVYCEYCKQCGFTIFSQTRFVEQMKSLTKMEESKLGPKGKRRMVWLGIKLNEYGENLSSMEFASTLDEKRRTKKEDVDSVHTKIVSKVGEEENNSKVDIKLRKTIDTIDTVDTKNELDNDKDGIQLKKPEHPEQKLDIGKKYHREYLCPCGKSYHTKEKFDEHIKACEAYKGFLEKYTSEVVNGVVNYLSAKEGYFNAKAIGEGIGNSNEPQKINEVCEALREQGLLTKSGIGNDYLYSYRRDIGEYTNGAHLLVFKCNECGLSTTNAGAWSRHNVKFGHNSEEAVRQGRDEQANFINLGEGSDR